MKMLDAGTRSTRKGRGRWTRAAKGGRPNNNPVRFVLGYAYLRELLHDTNDLEVPEMVNGWADADDRKTAAVKNILGMLISLKRRDGTEDTLRVLEGVVARLEARQPYRAAVLLTDFAQRSERGL